MADEPQPPPRLSTEERAEAETREMIERAERAWQRQVEREEAGNAGASPGQMTPLRWALIALAGAALAFLVAEHLTRIG